MIVSHTTFLIICLLMAAVLAIPFFYFRITKKLSKPGLLLLLPALVIPFALRSPDVIDVSDDGTYSKRVVVLPQGDFERGGHTYVVNHGEKLLYWEPIVYGNMTTDEVGLMCEGGQTIKCKGSIDYILTEAPDSIMTKNNKGALRYQLSYVPSYEEQMESYLEGYNEILKENPDNIEYLFYKGALLESIGRKDEAAQCFERAGAIQSPEQDHLYYKAASLARTEQWKDALKVYEAIDSSTAREDYIYSNMGYCCIGLNDMKKAYSYFEKAIELNSENITAHLGMAIANHKEGKNEEMVKAVNNAWEVDPSLSRSVDCIEELENNYGYYFSPREKQLLQEVLSATVNS